VSKSFRLSGSTGASPLNKESVSSFNIASLFSGDLISFCEAGLLFFGGDSLTLIAIVSSLFGEDEAINYIYVIFLNNKPRIKN
jgi:hypothetical protein